MDFFGGWKDLCSKGFILLSLKTSSLRTIILSYTQHTPVFSKASTFDQNSELTLTEHCNPDWRQFLNETCYNWQIFYGRWAICRMSEYQLH